MKRECKSGTVNRGTVNRGTVNRGTVNRGTVNRGTVNRGTVNLVFQEYHLFSRFIKIPCLLGKQNCTGNVIMGEKGFEVSQKRGNNVITLFRERGCTVYY